MNNQDQAAEDFKKNTERYRLVATVMTLPDIAYGGYKAVREIIEIRAMTALDRTTAQAATAMSGRTANATRAERFHQIAERANLRAQIRTEQIRAGLKLEIAPKGAGVGSTVLLVREEVQNDESAFHQFLRSLQVHSTTVHAQ